MRNSDCYFSGNFCHFEFRSLLLLKTKVILVDVHLCRKFWSDNYLWVMNPYQLFTDLMHTLPFICVALSSIEGAWDDCNLDHFFYHFQIVTFTGIKHQAILLNCSADMGYIILFRYWNLWFGTAWPKLMSWNVQVLHFLLSEQESYGTLSIWWQKLCTTPFNAMSNPTVIPISGTFPLYYMKRIKSVFR